jgi:hypothetical protein
MSSTNASLPGTASGSLVSKILNPYRKLKNIIVTDTNTPVNYNSLASCLVRRKKSHSQNVSAGATKGWGDNMYPKQQNHTRIYFQNINGVSTKDYSKWLATLDWLRSNEVDIIGLAEPCLNTQDPLVKQSYNSKLSYFGDRSFMQISPNTNPSESKYQPGGSLMICNEVWRSRIVNRIIDPRRWGRYIGFTFRLKQDEFLTVITAYRCVYRSNTTDGLKTSVKHQKSQMASLGIQSTVRSLCLDDLETSIRDCRDKYGSDSGIILLIDANESFKEMNSQLPEFLRKTKLVDVILNKHQYEEISSHDRSNSGRRIDFAFCNQKWCEYIKWCGYLPFYAGLDSDHRGIYLDLDLDAINDHRYYTQTKRMIGTNESEATIINYQNHIMEQFRYHSIITKADRYANTSENTYTIEDLNKLDKIITDIVLTAERKVAPKRPNIRWTPRIANVTLIIKYLKLNNKLKDSFEKTEILQGILNQLQDPHKSELLQKIDIHGNFKAEKKSSKIKKEDNKRNK